MFSIFNFYNILLDENNNISKRLVGNKTVSELKEKLGNDKVVLGLSGGVDSSYMALMSKRLGLNPLLVHFDYGWNSELAVQNIENIGNIENYLIKP